MGDRGYAPLSFPAPFETGFMGGDYDVAHVPEAARKVLKRFDARSTHYEHRKIMAVEDD